MKTYCLVQNNFFLKILGCFKTKQHKLCVASFPQVIFKTLNSVVSNNATKSNLIYFAACCSDQNSPSEIFQNKIIYYVKKRFYCSQTRKCRRVFKALNHNGYH